MSILQHGQAQSNMGEILNLSSKTGRKQPWRRHKFFSSQVAESYFRLANNTHFDTAKYQWHADEDGEVYDIVKLRTPYDRKAENILSCASWLKVGVCANGHKQLTGASFCRSRLCPMCAWRRSFLIAHQIKRVGHEVAQQQKVRWLFLTLTVRNMPFEELHAGITQLMEAFRKLSRYTRFKNAVLGWYRSLEVTRNLDKHSEWYGTFHPHLHVLLCVPTTYFKSAKTYIDQAEWTKMWQKALKVTYTPLVHIQVVKPKRNKKVEADLLADYGLDIGEVGDSRELTGAAIAETAKYSVKPGELVVFSDGCYCSGKCTCGNEQKPYMEHKIDEEETDFSVFAFDLVLSRRRLKAYGGLLKEVWNRLQQEEKMVDPEADDADLVGVTEDEKCTCSTCQSALLETLYRWQPGVNHYIST
ncbi:protein rep (plasmid) [Brevibacillus ruminantium]|uniref:Protein rep n=1 Tax=Brevibacillus ruminantium TaxID=2950604 RepID=A0ABY4WPG5_9BACL|nr:protein rep [Brevibacillus ruminantium]USG68549.1 protein rep [Brevibacillus ruminantium]